MRTDYQKSKVYKAEWRWDSTSPLNSELTRGVSLVEADEIVALLATEFGTTKPKVMRNPRMKAYGGWYRSIPPTIEFPSGHVRVSTVLHEFAHHLDNQSGHQWTFAQAMCRVVTAYFGAAASIELLRHYEEVGVDVEESQYLERVERNRRAARAAQNRRGKTGTVFTLVRTDANGSGMYYLSHNKTRLTRWSPDAIAVRRRSTIEKIYQDLWRADQYEIHEVDGVFDGDLNRWRIDPTSDLIR